MPHTATHVLSLNWDGIFKDSVENSPFMNDNYSFYWNQTLEETDYYESAALCPFCEVKRNEAGVLIVPALMKLKIKPTQTDVSGHSVILFNLFTCPHCERFFASIREIDGVSTFMRDVHGTPLYGHPARLVDYALISKPYDKTRWQTIVRESNKMTKDPEQAKVSFTCL